jgi:hypothetical protein
MLLVGGMAQPQVQQQLVITETWSDSLTATYNGSSLTVRRETQGAATTCPPERRACRPPHGRMLYRSARLDIMSTAQ